MAEVTSGAAHQTEVTASQFAVPGFTLVNGITYWWRVTAVNLAGTKASTGSNFVFTTPNCAIAGGTFFRYDARGNVTSVSACP
jgi:hypothetical protein